MKLLAPKYYLDFKCIADKCTHSCCVGWEIDIDEDTFALYSSLRKGYGATIVSTIEKAEYPHFKLCQGERCPHLDERGLCKIISNLGEGYLCEICKEHPRFYNDTPNGKELGLGLACEEACRVILSSDSYDEYVAIEEIEQDVAEYSFDATRSRECIYSCLKDASVPYDKRLEKIQDRFSIFLEDVDENHIKNVFFNLEYLNPENKSLFMKYSHSIKTPKSIEKELERAFAYFVYRHLSQAENEKEMFSAIGFSLLCERLLCSLCENEPDKIEEYARIISEEIEYSCDNTEFIKGMFGDLYFKMKRCDLHNHSICSDGSCTPTEVVLYAKEKGLCAIALTDHNTVKGLDEFTNAAKENGLEYIFGSELTTDYKGKEVHLIAMFINEKNAHRIKDFTDIQLERKKVSNIDLEKNLVNGGYDISLDKLIEKYGPNLNRAHFAKELVLKGYYKTTDEAFNSVLKSGNGFYNPPKRVTLFEGIELARSWGCVPVIAHPLLSVTKDELEGLLPLAKEKGLVGIEVYYPKFTNEEKDYLHSLAQKYDLVKSGGSDYHGNMKTNVDMDDGHVPYQCYLDLVDAYNKLR